MLSTAITMFIVGFGCLLFGDTKNPTFDIVGFVLITVGFILAVIN